MTCADDGAAALVERGHYGHFPSREAWLRHHRMALIQDAIRIHERRERVQRCVDEEGCGAVWVAAKLDLGWWA